jgi:ankyrin repeat protein
MSLGQFELEQDCISSIESNNLERVKQLLTNVFSINSFLRSKHVIWDTNCFSILSIAAFYGSINCVEYLLEKNAQVNQVDSLKNRTALHWAVVSGNSHIVQLLIDSGRNFSNY